MCMCLENFLSFYLYVCTYIWRRRRRKRRENIRERRRRRTGGGADAGGSAQGLSLPNQLGCFETTRTIKHRTLGWRKRKKKKLVRRTWWKRVGRRRRRREETRGSGFYLIGLIQVSSSSFASSSSCLCFKYVNASFVSIFVSLSTLRVPFSWFLIPMNIRMI